MSNPTLSFVCASNNKKTLDEVLLPSLKKQKNQDFELIVVDAKEKGFHSAAETLNYGASLTNGEYICFVHQDIEFLDDCAVDEIISYFENNDFGLAGVAGEISGIMNNKKKCKVISSVIHGPKRIHAGEKLAEVMKANSVDECVMFVKKKSFKGFSDIGPYWHLYGPDYSLKCLENGEIVLLFPINVYHLSIGFCDATYWKALKNITKVYPKEKIIHSCMENWKTGRKLKYSIAYFKLKPFVKKIIFYEKWKHFIKK